MNSELVQFMCVLLHVLVVLQCLVFGVFYGASAGFGHLGPIPAGALLLSLVVVVVVLLLLLLCSKTICMHSIIKRHRALSVTCAHKRNLKGVKKNK